MFPTLPVPATPPAADMDGLFERSQGDGFWLPDWAQVVDRPAVRYTWSHRDQHALNQVTRVRDLPEETLADVVAEVSRAHAGVTSRWLLAPGSQLPGLPALLEAGGWRFEHTHRLRTLSTDRARPASPGIRVRAVDDEQTLEDCIRVCERAFSRPAQALGSSRICDELAQLEKGRVHRFVAYDAATGEAMASAGLNTFPALGIGFLWGGGTDPAHRKRGAYRALVGARMARAQDRGCATVGVYARDHTSDPILAALGFVRHGTMCTWLRTP